MSKMEYFTLSNGNKIPAISILGTGTTWYDSNGTFSDELVAQLEYTLSLPGVIHIDAAEYYKRYPELGKALKNSPKPREEIWITDKFSRLVPSPKAALENSLKATGLDYVDLYLIHDPFFKSEKDLIAAWKEMEELYKEGKAKNIGVSNFGVKDFEVILPIAEIKPVANQIEYNAFLQNQTPGIYEYSQKNNILLEAYSPLGPLNYSDKTGPFYDYLDELTKKHATDAGSILLRWVYQTNVLPVTTSTKRSRVLESSKIFYFELAPSEVEKITQLGKEHPVYRQYHKKYYDIYN